MLLIEAEYQLPETLATSILSTTPPPPVSTLSQIDNDLGEPETESWSGGPLARRSVATSRDSFGRRQGVTASVAGQRWEDGLWTYTWDAENRLISMQSQALVPAAGRRKLDCEYDPLGRRIGRIVSTGPSGSWVPTSTTRRLYEGWNPVAELNGAGTLVREYVWGTDLSGSWQGAGGVGGLLWVLEAPTGPSINAHYVAYDGNGNVMGLVSAADGTWSARYEYGPFGEVIRATGAMAAANPFRWSTKIQDEDTGLNYYGYRYYSAGVGRWLGRDPIGERGGNNLLGFLANNSINHLDVLGLVKAEGGDAGHLDRISVEGCSLNLVVGHFIGDGLEGLDKFIGLNAARGCSGARIGFHTCGSDYLTGQLPPENAFAMPPEVWGANYSAPMTPEEEASANDRRVSLPNTRNLPYINSGNTTVARGGLAETDRVLAYAKLNACKDVCCKQVKIVVICSEGRRKLWDWEISIFRGLPDNPYEGIENPCGKSILVNCHR